MSSYTPNWSHVRADQTFTSVFHKHTTGWVSSLKSCIFKGIAKSVPHTLLQFPFCSLLSWRACMWSFVLTILDQNLALLFSNSIFYFLFGKISLLNTLGTKLPRTTMGDLCLVGWFDLEQLLPWPSRLTLMFMRICFCRVVRRIAPHFRVRQEATCTPSSCPHNF